MTQYTKASIRETLPQIIFVNKPNGDLGVDSNVGQWECNLSVPCVIALYGKSVISPSAMRLLKRLQRWTARVGVRYDSDFSNSTENGQDWSHLTFDVPTQSAARDFVAFFGNKKV